MPPKLIPLETIEYRRQKRKRGNEETFTHPYVTNVPAYMNDACATEQYECNPIKDGERREIELSTHLGEESNANPHQQGDYTRPVQNFVNDLGHSALLNAQMRNHIHYTIISPSGQIKNPPLRAGSRAGNP